MLDLHFKRLALRGKKKQIMKRNATYSMERFRERREQESLQHKVTH
jgi:hypothetical protein